MPPASSDNFSHDVFVSYRQREPDRGWVRSKLLPQLQARGVRVFIDFRDFRLGSPLVLEMARGVETSRFTLAVLSPAYLASSFTELEGVLAEHLGLEEGHQRLLAVLREPCAPRLGFRARLWLDMTVEDEFDEKLEILVGALSHNQTL